MTALCHCVRIWVRGEGGAEGGCWDVLCWRRLDLAWIGFLPWRHPSHPLPAGNGVSAWGGGRGGGGYVPYRRGSGLIGSRRRQHTPPCLHRRQSIGEEGGKGGGYVPCGRPSPIPPCLHRRQSVAVTCLAGGLGLAPAIGGTAAIPPLQASVSGRERVMGRALRAEAA
jgi:hypothetical protein